MITVTRLDGTMVLVNVDQIESIEQTPDTIVTLANGHKILTRDLPDELVARIVEFKRRVERVDARDVTAADDGRTIGLAQGRR